jgi:hypothetical protein
VQGITGRRQWKQIRPDNDNIATDCVERDFARSRDQQCRGAPPEWLVRQPTRQAIPRCPFAPAAPAPLIRFGDPAGQHRAVRLKALPDDFEAELINANEQSGQGK